MQNTPINESFNRSSFSSQKRGSFTAKTLLVVDDDNGIQSVVERIFTICAKGYKVLTAANGKEAINVLRSIPVDILLTDLDMPIMDGYELLSYIGRNHPRMKAIVMTGSGDPEVQVKLQPLGISRFIKKPFGIFEVLDRVMQEFGDTPVPLT